MSESVNGALITAREYHEQLTLLDNRIYFMRVAIFFICVSVLTKNEYLPCMSL